MDYSDPASLMRRGGVPRCYSDACAGLSGGISHGSDCPGHGASCENRLATMLLRSDGFTAFARGRSPRAGRRTKFLRQEVRFISGIVKAGKPVCLLKGWKYE
jgi:hypothetical protein